jgi:hypothetical protein
MYKEHPIPCPKCGRALRHRGLSGIRFCVNESCVDYHGIPPITIPHTEDILSTAMNKESWATVQREIDLECKDNG